MSGDLDKKVLEYVKNNKEFTAVLKKDETYFFDFKFSCNKEHHHYSTKLKLYGSCINADLRPLPAGLPFKIAQDFPGTKIIYQKDPSS